MKGRYEIRGEDDKGCVFGLSAFDSPEEADAELARIRGDWHFTLWVQDTEKRFQVYCVEDEKHFVYETFDAPYEARACVEKLRDQGAETYAVDSQEVVR